MKYPFLFGDSVSACSTVGLMFVLPYMSVMAVRSDCNATQDLGIEVTAMQSRTNS
jgi:hypothetical protein